jgi:hypothetical protein
VITRAAVLEQLDDAARRFVFPMLDNGYVYPVTVRLTAYRDPVNWAVVVDAFGVSPRAGGIDACHNCIHAFGNCLDGDPGVSNDSFVYSVSEGPGGPCLDDPYDEMIGPGARDILVRGTVISVSHDPERYAARGIDLIAPPSIYLFELMRLIAEEEPTPLFATAAELRKRLAVPVPVFLEADEWRHPDLAAQELPSGNEAFASLAEALEAGDAARFRPGSPPNTHWSNWPAGGTL